MRILIAGAGNFGREVAGWMELRGRPVAGFIDDENPDVATIQDYVRQDDEEVLVAIADPRGREHVARTLIERGAVFHGLWMMTLSPSAKIGGGCIFCPGSVVSCLAKIGDFVHVNLNATIGHDVVLGDCCTVSCHVDLMGHVEVGRRVFFGSGARVLPGVRIGDDARIGAGAVVTADVPAGRTVYCQPGRIL